MVDIDVRVASTVKLFRRSIVNYPAFNAFFQRADLTKSEKAVFTSITMAEWELVVQLEAVVQRIADLALVESQSATMLSSTMYILLWVASARMNSYKFSAFSLHGTRNTDTNEKMFARRQITLPDLSVLAQRCIKRTLHQIAFRLPQPGVPMGMALLLDPRTKRAAKNYLQIPDWARAATGHILEDTKVLLLAEHRVMYKALHINEDAEGDAVNSAASSPGRDCSSSSDTELDLLCGEEVLKPVDSTPTDVSLNAKADAVMEQWLDLRIDWEEVVRHQIPDKQECDRVLSKLAIRNKKQGNVRVWNVEQLCQQVDVWRWFADYGQARFPSVAKFARVWLGRSCSTAFQERVFSTATLVMNSLRTSTDNERAERQLIMRHNREEMKRMDESKHRIW
ncbi:hypothetical protein V7S43_007147 [Phytophthora oleae]|uniref:HAT C-terminal dimerisation domain-containing protein n=1 Tax=Phytophthora oleae TaxID=2107226 RepID=A0ABD3FL12_9STRA